MTPVDMQGERPVILGLPNTGTFAPHGVAERPNDRGRSLADTDWHQATCHRYMIDANRDPSAVSLYPGQNTTTLVPLTDFDGDIWDEPPTEAETCAQLSTVLQALADLAVQLRGTR